MKTQTLIGTSRWALLGAVILSIFAIAMASRSKTGSVKIEKEVIEIPHVVSLSEKDLSDLNKILTDTGKESRVYKIQTYKRGKLEKHGEYEALGCLQLTAAMKSAAAAAHTDAKKQGLSDVAIQIGAELEEHAAKKSSASKENPMASPTASLGPQSCNMPLRDSDRAAAKELLEKVTPILKRYSGK